MNKKMPPFDQAKELLKLSQKEQIIELERFSSQEAADILCHLDASEQFDILVQLQKATTDMILASYSTDDLLELLSELELYKQDTLIQHLPTKRATAIKKWLKFAKNTAGRYITDNVLTFDADKSVKEAISYLRSKSNKLDSLSYLYVLTKEAKLIGVLSIQELLGSQDEEILAEIMLTNIITVTAATPLEEVSLKIRDYDLSALPIVDMDQTFLGVVTFDDAMDQMSDEQTEDMQRIGGSAPLEKPYLKTSIWSLYRKRIFWLLFLFLAEAYTGTVIAHYEETLTKVIALSFFIPLLVGTGGNTGTQITTTMIRSIATGEVKFKDMFKIIRKEVSLSFLIGLSIAIIALFRATILGVGGEVALVVAITALCIVIWTSIVASILPLVLNKLKLDPAVVSGPFITTFVDGTGLIIYFTVAKILLGL